MTTNIGKVRPVRIEEEMRGSYLDYAMSVIVSRALPDVRDGLKPVQRRILFAMNELGLHPTSPHKKSARIVGEVLGKYHPHGDAPVYEAMVRMAQDFSMRYVLIDGQGNFGSVDGDPPAAMRYTEARLAPIAQEMLADIDKNTVDFVPNFDGTLREPTILPAILPNLLVNGSSGIAVGMATNIPPHNLGEVCDGIIHLIDNPDATLDELLELIQGPDFPTAAMIQGKQGIKQAYTTGLGKIILRARTTIEEVAKGKRTQILITELPYQTNKATLVEKIAELAREKKIDGIGEIRDESDREGMRVVIELRREAQPEQVLNNLYKHTALQSAFFINMLALVDGQPRVINLKTALQHYIDFRRQVIERRSEFELARARDRAHILEGLVKAIQYLDEVIALIRKSSNVDEARNALMKRFALSQVQAQAILDMQLRRLSALERQKLLDEQAEVLKAIARLEAILADPKLRDALIKDEVGALRSKYADRRLTEINEEEPTEFRIADLIPHQEVVITLSQRGYVKRLPSDTYRLQRRGGRGVTGVVTRDEDAVQHLLVADTHDLLLFFTNRGKAFPIRCYEIAADSSRTSKGTPLVNLIPLSEKERVMAVLALSDEAQDRLLLLPTQLGKIKKTPLKPFTSMRSGGLIATKLGKGDELVSASLAWDDNEAIFVTEKGRALKLRVADVPMHSRHGSGVRGIRPEPGDRVIAMDIVKPDSYLLTVTARGFGKRTPLRLYPSQNRGGKGIYTFRIGEKTGPLAAARVVYPGQEVMMVSEKGVVIRTDLDEVSIQGRLTKGVSVMKLDEDDSLVSVACLNGQEDKRHQPEKKGKSNTKNQGRG